MPISVQSPSNGRIKEIAALLKKEGREAAGMFIAEGDKLITEGLKSGLQIKFLIYDEQKAVSRTLISEARKSEAVILRANERVIRAVSDVKTPQGVAAVFEMRKNDFSDIKRGQKGIILENLQDPGNVGTIIRTAESFGIDFVICCNCADIYSPKVVRSAMGSLFREKIILASSMAEIGGLSEKGFSLYCAALDKDSLPVSEIKNRKDIAVVIGNEGAGVSDECRRMCAGSIKIPICEPVESLNAAVAAAVILWEMRGV